MHQLKVSVFGGEAGEIYSCYCPNIKDIRSQEVMKHQKLHRDDDSKETVMSDELVRSSGGAYRIPSFSLHSLGTQHIARPVNKLLYGIGKLAASFLNRDLGVVIFFTGLISNRNFPRLNLSIPESVNCCAFNESVTLIEDTT